MFDVLIKEVSTRFGLSGDKAVSLVQMLLASMTNKDTGGLTGFIDKFKSAGLGSVVQSWMGGGDNAQAISPDQISRVLGGPSGLMQLMASKLGIGASTGAAALAFLLPKLVGRLTPGGSLPAAIPQDVLGFVGNAKSVLAGGAAAASAKAKSGGHNLLKLWPMAVVAIAATLALHYCNKPQEKAPKLSEVSVAAPSVAAPASAAASAPASEPASAPSVIGELKAKISDAIPTGAGALFSMVGDNPAMKVYFDSGKTDIAPEFAESAKPLAEYVKAHADVKVVVSGFNDPTGDAAANAVLSKKRAEAVAAALQSIGVPEASIVLEKPADTVAGTDSNAQARRVEVTLRK